MVYYSGGSVVKYVIFALLPVFLILVNLCPLLTLLCSRNFEKDNRSVQPLLLLDESNSPGDIALFEPLNIFHLLSQQQLLKLGLSEHFTAAVSYELSDKRLLVDHGVLSDNQVLLITHVLGSWLQAFVPGKQLHSSTVQLQSLNHHVLIPGLGRRRV